MVKLLFSLLIWSKQFSFGDHFIDSDNLFSWLYIDIVRRILMLHGLSWGLKC